VSMGNPSRNDDLGRFWALDPAVIFLNHGSFGACPLPVLEAQQRLRERIEREPVRFFVRELQELLDAARQELAAFVGADPGDLVFVPNATYAVNSVLRSLPLNPGDELLTTDHEYNACKNALEFAASRSNARVVTARVPFPLRSPQQAVAAVLDSATPRTRLALIDHVTSQTGLVFPVAELVAELAERGVEVMVDGAHAGRRGGFLHRQLPQVALCSQGGCVPGRTARSSADRPPLGHQPRSQLGKKRPLPLLARVRLHRNR
jgi:isopenicillin-N epimerase